MKNRAQQIIDARKEPDFPIGAGIPDSELEQAITAVSSAVYTWYGDHRAREVLAVALRCFAAAIKNDGLRG